MKVYDSYEHNFFITSIIIAFLLLNMNQKGLPIFNKTRIHRHHIDIPTITWANKILAFELT